MTDTYVLGDVVHLAFYTYDDGELAAPTTAVLTVTLPNGSTTTPTMTHDGAGTFTLDYTPGAVGRYAAAFVATGAAGGAAVDVFDVVSTTESVVTLAQVKTYLGTTSASDATITGALDAERSAQSDVCRIDDYTPALREALFRRVARNLAMRRIPLAIPQGDADGGPSFVPGRDPEVRRLESPFRRRVVG